MGEKPGAEVADAMLQNPVVRSRHEYISQSLDWGVEWLVGRMVGGSSAWVPVRTSKFSRESIRTKQG